MKNKIKEVLVGKEVAIVVEPSSKEHDLFLQSLDIEAYWQEQMVNRYDIRLEVWRLEIVLKGHYYDHREFSEKSNRPVLTLIEFHGSKRPYGNKNIPKSIAFQLGWDRLLMIMGDSDMAGQNTFPKWVEEEAMKLHELVLEELKNG